MPDFPDPFSGKTPDRLLTLRELTRALRLNLAAEQEAVSLYEAHADATDHPLAKRVLQDIANEEREHAGEFQRLLSILLADEQMYLDNGAAEVEEMAGMLGGAAAPAEEAASAAGEQAAGQPPENPQTPPTIGSLR
ncbi:MAG: demethoxyubiquinone hydroxylase family protein [Armatimonadetes bacterium]|nr:demethoxyubiquinone hydroxylase family protein [Armatimonadota bacterium]